jgi:uncharacterized membrane protein
MSDINATVDVKQPLRTVYNQWTQFEEFPNFMEGIEEVTQVDETTLIWRAQIAGIERTWRSRIVKQEPDQAIEWVSTEGSRNSGRVTFEALGPSTTRVQLALDLEPQDLVEKVGQGLGLVARRAQEDLDRFRQFIEDRFSETGAWRGQIRDGEVDGAGRSLLEAPPDVDPEGTGPSDSHDRLETGGQT